MAVLHGWPETTAVQSSLVAPDRIFPVAAPSVLDDIRLEQGIEGLLDYPLLELAETRRDWMTWSDFLMANGVSRPPAPKAVFDSYAIAIEAARLGQGLLLGWNLVIERHLNDGSLRQIGAWSMDSPGGLRLHFNPSHMSEPAKTLMRWFCPSGKNV
jgi:DNA-binding transcriptional LysR family regulator